MKNLAIKKKDKTNKAIFVGDLILTKLEAPEINENRTNGTTSIFINWIKISPKGLKIEALLPIRIPVVVPKIIANKIKKFKL